MPFFDNNEQDMDIPTKMFSSNYQNSCFYIYLNNRSFYKTNEIW